MVPVADADSEFGSVQHWANADLGRLIKQVTTMSQTGIRNADLDLITPPTNSD
jgi:hypothetical protein